MIQILAMSSMLADHVKYIGIDNIYLTLFGRIASIYFLYACGVGLSKTRSHKKYFIRLLACAISAQIIFMYAGFGTDLNVVFLMALAAFYFWKGNAAILPLAYLMDYGFPGLLMIASGCLRHLPLLLLSCLWLNGVGLSSIVTALLGASVYYLNRYRQNHLPRYFFYYFFPAHFAILWIWSSLARAGAGGS